MVTTCQRYVIGSGPPHETVGPEVLEKYLCSLESRSAGHLILCLNSGDLDAGVLIHLVHDKGYDAGKVEDLVNHQAGLLGVSGLSPDMKTLLEQRSREPHAAQAIELFCYQLRKCIGALTTVLGGLDTLVFTGGILPSAPPRCAGKYAEDWLIWALPSTLSRTRCS